MTRKTSPKVPAARKTAGKKAATSPNLALTVQAAPSTKQMQVVKVTCRSRVKGERRFPYRVLGLPLDADLNGLAGAILDAFDFDHDHAYGFFDTKNPYQARVAFELFTDGESGDQGGAPDEAEVAISLGMELLDPQALLAETAGFLTARLQEQMLPLMPERLREQVRERLSELAAELLDLPDFGDDEASSLPGPLLEMLRQPGGMDQLLSLYGSASGAAAVGSALGLPASGQKQEYGVAGVPLSALFGQQNSWTFLFDYGDDWMFDVVDQGTRPAEPKKKLPALIETLGTAPEQYPAWDDE